MIFLLLDAVTDLDGFVGVHGWQQINPLQYIHIFISLLDGSILDNVIERSSIQCEGNRISLSLNRCCSRSIVQESQFTKWFSRLVSLLLISIRCSYFQVGIFSALGETLITIQLPRVHHIQVVTIFSLLDHPITLPNHYHTKSLLEMLLIHRIDNNVAFLILQSLEHEGLHQPLDDAVLGILLLGNHSGHKILIHIYILYNYLFFVEWPISLSAYWYSAHELLTGCLVG